MSALFTKVLPWPKIIMVKSLTASWPNSKPVPRPEALFWKAVALGNIEHGVLFEKRDMAHFVRVGRLLDLGNEIHLDPVFPFCGRLRRRRGRVAGLRRRRPAPSEPCMRVSPHTAQANRLRSRSPF